MQFENPVGMAELIELGGSAAVVLLMGVAAVLGFRMSAGGLMGANWRVWLTLRARVSTTP